MVLRELERKHKRTYRIHPLGFRGAFMHTLYILKAC